VAPEAGWPCKILLASVLGERIADPAAHAQLAALNRSGAIQLCRVDLVGAIPEDRRTVYEKSLTGRWYDCIAWDGELLAGWSVR
jgi:hypothetical protein